MAYPPRARPPAPGRRPPPTGRRPPPGYGTGYPPGYGRQPGYAARPQQRRRGAHAHHSHGHGSRNLLIVSLLLVTVAVGGWYFLLRSSGEPSGDYLVAESRFVESAREIPTAAANVHRMLDLAAFDETFATSIAKMKAQVAVFERLGNEEEGEALSVAQASQTAAQTAVTTATVFQDALHRNRFADARVAKSQFESAVRELEKRANEWKKL